MKTEQYIAEYQEQLTKLMADREKSILDSKENLVWLEKNKDSIPEWLYWDGVHTETDNVNFDQGFYLEREQLIHDIEVWTSRLRALNERRGVVAA